MARTSVPAPKSMASLITSGFNKSSRREEVPSKRNWRGEVGTSHRSRLEFSAAFSIPRRRMNRSEAIGVARGVMGRSQIPALCVQSGSRAF
jgi:hypothetical protein